MGTYFGTCLSLRAGENRLLMKIAEQIRALDPPQAKP